MNARWAISYLEADADQEPLQVVQVYAAHENKEVVKRENKGMQLTRKRELILIERRLSSECG